jgi:MFS family permease
MGEPGVGALNAAMGLGGLAGAVAAIALAGQARLSPAFGLAMAGWGAPIAVIGVIVHPGVALLAMLAVGVSNAFIDVSGFTLIQRTTPNTSRIAVLGLVDSVANGGVAVGGLVAPILIEALGVRGALVASGLILPAAALLFAPALRRMDEGGVGVARRVELVRGEPLFAPLSLATVEHLAAALTPLAFDDGAWLMREGEPGLEYVLVDTGNVVVSQHGRAVRTLGPGSGVGEIALMHDVPRTASVRAAGPVTAFSLDHEAFLEAVTGHTASRAIATSRAGRHLAADSERPVLH